MMYKIVEHFNAENGHFTGYELKQRPFFFVPWISVGRYDQRCKLEHDLIFLLTCYGNKVKTGYSYD